MSNETKEKGAREDNKKVWEGEEECVWSLSQQSDGECKPSEGRPI